MKATPTALLALVFTIFLQTGCVEIKTRRLAGHPTMSRADAIAIVAKWGSIRGHYLHFGRSEGSRALHFDQVSDMNGDVRLAFHDEQWVAAGKGTIVDSTQVPLSERSRLGFASEYVKTPIKSEQTHFSLEFSTVDRIQTAVGPNMETQEVMDVYLWKQKGRNVVYSFHCTSPEWVERLSEALLVLCPNAR
jgi:hypothetical protein